MSVNKVQLANGETIIDISDSTVTPETLAEGVTAHDASGQKITGKMVQGGGTFVQADWNQTDETAPDFIKNKPESLGGGASSWNELTDKPVVTVGEPDTLTWDGDTTGRVIVEGGNVTDTVKVSDAVPTMADFANGCTVVAPFMLDLGAETDTFTLSASDILQDGEALSLLYGGVFIVPYDNCDATQEWSTVEIIFPEKGVYFVAGENGAPWVTSLTIPGYTGFAKEQIDPEFLPEPLQFGESETGGDTLTWDGNTEGLESAIDLFYRVSDATPTMADFANGLSFSFDTTSYTVTPDLVATSVVEMAEDSLAVINGSPMVVIVPKDNIAVEDGIVFSKKGLYFFRKNEYGYVTSLTIPGYTGFPLITPVAEKYIPDTIQRVGDDVILNSSTAGSTKKFKLTVDDSGTITATEVT